MAIAGQTIGNENPTPTANRFAVQQARIKVIDLARKLVEAFGDGLDFDWEETCKNDVEFERRGTCPQCGTEFVVRDKESCGGNIECEKFVGETDVPMLRELKAALVTLDILSPAEAVCTRSHVQVYGK
jgi:hypothetical protein